MSTFEKTVKKGPIGADLCTPICAPFLSTRRVIYAVLVCYITAMIVACNKQGDVYYINVTMKLVSSQVK